MWFERNGFCLLYKRLHGAVFELPLGEQGSTTVRIDSNYAATGVAAVVITDDLE